MVDYAEIYYVLLRSKQKIVIIISLLMQITLLSATAVFRLLPYGNCRRSALPRAGKSACKFRLGKDSTIVFPIAYTSDLMKLLGVQGRLGVGNCLIHDTAIDS